MQQAADVAADCGRKIAFVGRSMRKNANIARNLGYMNVPDDLVLASLTSSREHRRYEQLILCSGQPGRADVGDDPNRLQRSPSVSMWKRGDTVIISAKPISK